MVATRRGKRPRADSPGAIGVYLDLGAGTQSARRPAERAGLAYVPVDLRGKVYSVVEGQYVDNLVLNYTTTTPEELWERVVRHVAPDADGAVELRMLWASPNCHTFSMADAINIGKGCNYRDHDDPEKPPVREEGVYRAEAMQADRQVQHVLRMIEYFLHRFPGMSWCVENPVGNLQKRPYMRDLELAHTRHTVDYCAYGSQYKKPTNIWTNIAQWRPRGDTDCGLCRSRCRSGYRTPHNRWQHVCKIAGPESRVDKRDGRRARREMVPQRLHDEICAAAAGEP